MPRRSRVPKASALASTFARALGLGASVVLLANLVYESVNWPEKTHGLTITAAVVALIVDGYEITALVDSTRTIPRAAPPCLVCLDILVLCIAAPSVFFILIDDYQREVPDGGWPYADADYLSFLMTTIICGLRFLFLVWSCVVCVYWIRRRPRRAERRESRDAPTESTGELQDVGHSS
ncbi:hypothetical protein F4779DRAFT_604691 [Xylariaceae sp. FL0662B]|nr:hypothetical protein F4779DRAFT_604691 [Xylariaceae sp. FL0662B]